MTKKPGGLPTGKNAGLRDEPGQPGETEAQRRARRRRSYLREYTGDRGRNDPYQPRNQSEGHKKAIAARNFESGQRSTRPEPMTPAERKKHEYLVRNNPDVGDPHLYRNQTHQGHEAARVRYFEAGQRTGKVQFTDAEFRPQAARRTNSQNASISKGAQRLASRANSRSDVDKVVSIMRAAKRRLTS